MKKIILKFLLCIGCCVYAQQPAFPTAYGGGAYATGGRGGTVYHVTNLNNDGTGSFRAALSQPRPAIIVFDVSGVIDCTTKLWITGNDLTIAGQTAPEGGITITTSGNNTNPQFGNSSNIIIRYIRFRMQFYGDTALTIYPGSSEGDSANNIILDHVSISYAGLQGFTVRGKDTYNITFQNGLIAESKTGSLFGDTDPNNAGFSYNNTFRNTLFYNISHRTPNSSSGRTDIYNNVVYDWINRWTVVKTNALVNHFNNYIFTGNKTTLFTQWQQETPVWQVNGVTNENPTFPPSIYSAGNIVQDLFEDPLEDNTQTLWIEHAFSGQTERVDPALFRVNPHAYIGRLPIFLTAVEASVAIPIGAGSNKFLNEDGTVGLYRDAQDTRYINNTINDTPEPWTCCNSGANNNRHSAIEGSDYVNFISSINGTPINTRPASYDTDNDGMADIWETATFGDLTKDGTADTNGNGYSDLEEFLNQVDVEIVITPIAVTSVTITPSTATTAINTTTQLTRTILPIDATDKTGNWSTSNGAIATVSQTGLVEGKSVGTATITYTTTDGSFTDTSTITVTETSSSGGTDAKLKLLISN